MDIRYWLRLANSQVSPRAANAAIAYFGSIEDLFAASLDELCAVPEVTAEQAQRLLDPSFEPSSAQLAHAEGAGIDVIPDGTSAYPEGLRELPDRPPALFVRGELDERDRFAVSIVGTRRPSPYGRSIAARLASDLSQMGLTIVSGGALGVDTAAHHAAVAAGGRTIVVLGCGLDIRYPADNQRLFDQIASGHGAVVSEFGIGATPEAWRFPMRNRIISAMSLGVIVVEAGQQSGALITASLAGEQGREVLAVPGNIDRPHSKGTNALIRDGATLVTCARDVADALGLLVLEQPRESAQSQRAADLPERQRRIVERLSLTPKHIDAIAAEVQLSAAEAGAELTMLELAGHVHRQPGGCYIRAL